MFASGLMIALPAVTALLIINFSLGVMTRAAPQMNIFSLGVWPDSNSWTGDFLITLAGILPQFNGLTEQTFASCATSSGMRAINRGGRNGREMKRTEKSEQPTGRRLNKAREEGQVPRSKELATTAILILGAISILVFGQGLPTASHAFFFPFSLTFRVMPFLKPKPCQVIYLAITQEVVLAMAPFMAVMVVAAILGNTGLGGWNFSLKALGFKLANSTRSTGSRKWSLPTPLGGIG